MESRVSWHPAFMPNSISDLQQKTEHPTSKFHPELSHPKSESSEKPLQLGDVAHSSEDVQIGPGESAEHIREPGELDNLHNTLTGSLSSPGGFEMDENPAHDGILGAGNFKFDDPSPRAEIPSEGPAREPGHASSASFARTVPRDVDWGEDDDVDPEWNLQRTRTDPFKGMAPLDRTNSFPQVPPSHNVEDTFDRTFSKHHAGDLLGRIEHTPSLFEDDNNDDDFFGHTGDADAMANGAPEDLLEKTGEDGYGTVYGGSITNEVKSDLRYDEGLPLVEDEELTKDQRTYGQHTGSAIFADNDANGEDFFGELANLSSIGSRPDFGRKSTIQVTGGLGLQTIDPSSDDMRNSTNAEGTQSPLEKATGGGIAVLQSTVVSQVLQIQGESERSFLGENEMHPASLRPPGTEDLAAKWKAALDGDEFLDEDELLDEEGAGSLAVDPAAVFGSDDEGFLDDDELAPNEAAYQQISPALPGPVIGRDGKTAGFGDFSSGARPQSVTSNSRYLPQNAIQSTNLQPTNSYAPQAPLLTDLSAQSVQSHLPYGADFGSALLSGPSSSLPPQQRPDVQKSQSFADKSKGGYASPYDLPMEVVKPRKRASMQQMNRGHNTFAPPSNVLPPRSSSMVAQGPPPSRGSASSISPTLSSSALHQPPNKPPHVPGSAQQAGPPGLKTKASFFEDLPLTSKPKPAGRHSPQPNPSIHGVNTTPSISSAYHPPQPTPSQIPAAAQGLVAPPKASPYAPLPTGQPQPPIPTSRYSPAPSRSSSGNTPPPVPALNRYASAPSQTQQPSSSYASQVPAPAAPPPPQMLAHQPRTSSPLIHFERAPDRQPLAAQSVHGGFVRRESSGFDMGPRPTNLTNLEKQVSGDLHNLNTVAASNSPHPAPILPHDSQPAQQHLAQASMSPIKREASNYLPDYRPGNVTFEPSFVPPKRSQTQSPSKVMAGSRIDSSAIESMQRPSSVHSHAAPRIDAYSTMNTGQPKTQARGLSQNFNYIAPTDGRENDPLQRWRGGPVFSWGVGGTVITSFPKEVPRYGIGQTKPTIICSPGELKVRNLKDFYPLEEKLAAFPGPLKGKSKKKEVIAWLTAGIDILEREILYLRSLATLAHEDKRKEERVLLWKILRVMIENDGLLEGNPAVNKSVRSVLSPGLDNEESAAAPQYATGADLSGIFRATGSSTLSEPVDPSAVDELRKHLLRGEREKAVWEAVDKRLWAHAMLVSNTVSRELYKQVAQEFIQKEVKNIGENTESLAALYEIFAGNLEESVDELVPPSARAGLQMVSASGPLASSKSSLDGLDRWRETLGLVLSNRSPEDSQAINALGKLLSGYGRAEAAHICFLFARGCSVFGGVDDPLSNIVLVGSDHLRQPYEFDTELEPILLSEVFEYGLSLSTTTNISFSAPHLAVYKLQHATILAQSGQRDKALQYCEAIASSITSPVRRSLYHHSFLVAALDDLSKRLKQSPKDETSSWISKPSIDKVSGSVWAKFNKFVAGDENDAASGGGSDAGSEIGPFARIAGDTPSISRSPSNGDIYGTLAKPPVNGNLAHLQSQKSHSRYAPAGAHNSSTVHEFSNPSSYDSQPQGSFAHRFSLEDRLRDRGSFGSAGAPSDPLARSYPDPAPTVPYESYLHSGSPYGAPYSPPHPITPPHEQEISLSTHESPRSMAGSEGNPPAVGYTPTASGGYQPASESSYPPPSSGGYEPPSYEPFEMNEEPDSPVDTRPKKKKGFMDDDEDDQRMTNTVEKANRGGSGVEKSKAEKDREADEAFRKAAEADAKKEAQLAPAKKGWGLGGWFAKRESTPDAAQPNKPIRAKLGEESSFVYDPELKRWINKKASKDEASEGPSNTPPPPRAGPPRTVSGSPMTETTTAPRPIVGSAPLQRSVSAFNPGSANSQSDGPSPSALTIPPPMMRTASNGSAAGGPPSGPPSRPTTSTSNASSIDDLLGPPQVRKGGAKKPKKGRGYIDVMKKE